MAMIDEIAATDSPARRAMKGSVIVRNPCAIPEGSVASAKAIGLGQFATCFGLSECAPIAMSQLATPKLSDGEEEGNDKD